MPVVPTKSNGPKKRLIKTNDEVGGITEAKGGNTNALQDESADSSKVDPPQVDHLKTNVSVDNEQDKPSRSIRNQPTVSHIPGHIECLIVRVLQVCRTFSTSLLVWIVKKPKDEVDGNGPKVSFSIVGHALKFEPRCASQTNLFLSLS